MEIWKDIIGLNGLYKISSLGRVKSVRKNKILKYDTSPSGYLFIGIRNKKYRLHRLVATHFIPNPLKYNQVNHKDLNKKNNCINNLEWCTWKDNLMHAIKNGKKLGRFLGMNDFVYIKDCPVNQYDLSGNFIKSYPSMSSAAWQFGSTSGNISRNVNGKTSHAYGFIWKKGNI